jgi:chromosome segregation ATPase
LADQSQHIEELKLQMEDLQMQLGEAERDLDESIRSQMSMEKRCEALEEQVEESGEKTRAARKLLKKRESAVEIVEKELLRLQEVFAQRGREMERSEETHRAKEESVWERGVLLQRENELDDNETCKRGG